MKGKDYKNSGFFRIKPGFVAVVLILVLSVVLGAMWQKNRIRQGDIKKTNWQEVKSNYSPIVAVFGQVNVGSKAAMEIDPETGEVGFGARGQDNNKPQLFTKMKGGNFQAPVTEGNKIKWQEVLPGVDVELHTFDGHLKEFIYIKSASAAHKFEFDLTKDFASSAGIELRDDGGMIITAVDKKTGEELLTLDYPIAVDARGKKIPYHYRLVGDKTVVMEVHEPKLLADIKYPLIVDPPMTIREYDEVLVKVGQNGEEGANAKDGDVVMIKPMGWPWGDMEYRDYVVVRINKLTEEEREKYTQEFSTVSDQEKGQAMMNKLPPPKDPAPYLRNAKKYGLDYVALLADERVKAYKINQDKTEEEASKNGLLEILRDRGADHPVLDATGLSLNELFQQKEFARLFEEIQAGKSRLALSDLPKDESVLPGATRLAKRIEEKKSWLASMWDKIIKPARAATNTYTIGTSSRNYSTIQAWENARDGNLVGANSIEKGECYNDSTFTAGVTIDGSTTNSSYYMWLSVAAGNRHSGTAGTGVKIDPTSAGSVVLVYDDYSIVEWLEVTGYGTSSGGYTAISPSSASNSTVRFNLIHDNVNWGGSYGIGHYDTGGGDNIYNNIIYSGTEDHSFGEGIYAYWASSSVNVYNNTVYMAMTSGGNAGICGSGNSSSSILAKNNIVVEVSSDAVGFLVSDGASFGSSNYNASSDTTSPGANSLDNITAGATFTTTTLNSENLHLKSTASSVNAGDDLSATFTTDIDAQTRPTGAGTWDIGADEYIDPNSAPTITSASDTPDPTNPGRSVTFIADWNDADSGETIKIKICKTNALTGQNCDGGYWASSTAFTTTDPVSLTYDVVAGDAGNTRDYAVFVCDDGGSCSAGTTGTFAVNGKGAVPNVLFR